MIPEIEERNRKIVELAKLGYPPKAIAERFRDLSPVYISVILSKARSAGENIPKFGTHGGHARDIAAGKPLGEFQSINVRGGALDELAGAARSRGLSPAQLARRIVETVAHENLVDAVLDDAAAP